MPDGYLGPVSEAADHDKVWVEYGGRWYPGVLETWDRRDGVLRCWVSYAVPVNGWPGGWYADVLADAGHDPNGEGIAWDARVASSRPGS
jgi:hypothetical protein